MSIGLTFLGTSSGVPTRRRNVSGLAVHTGPGAQWLLVDCGEGTQHQLLRTRLNLRDLQGVFITHSHGDHILGLPGLLASAGMQGRQTPLALVAPRAVLDWLHAVPDLFLPYPLHATAWDEPGAGAPLWQGGEAAHTVQVRPHALVHRVPSVAFEISVQRHSHRLDGERLRALGLPPGPLWGALQAGDDVTWQGSLIANADVLHHTTQTQTLVVGGDNAEPQRLREVCARAQLLVHEATYTRAVLDKVGPQYMHSCAADVARMAAQAGLPNLVLTHFSPRFDNQADGLEPLRTEAAAHYPGHLVLAEDLARYTLHDDGRLVHEPNTLEKNDDRD